MPVPMNSLPPSSSGLPDTGTPVERSVEGPAPDLARPPAHPPTHDPVDAQTPAASQALSDVLSDALTEALALVRERVGAVKVDTAGDGAESVADHAGGTLAILEALRVDEATRLAGVLFGPGKALALDEIESRFGTEVRVLVEGMRELLRLKDLTLKADAPSTGEELETLRRMTLAMASDIRVVLIRLASRLQTLRHHAGAKTSPAPAVARELRRRLAEAHLLAATATAPVVRAFTTGAPQRFLSQLHALGETSVPVSGIALKTDVLSVESGSTLA